MPSYARFTTMDPLCEKYYSISPFAYCADNPVNWVDPQGDSVVVNYWGYIIDRKGEDNNVYLQDHNDLSKIGELDTTSNEAISEKVYYRDSLCCRGGFSIPDCF